MPNWAFQRIVEVENMAEATKKPSKKTTSKFRPEFVEEAYRLALLGLTNDEIASYWEVATTTMEHWLHVQPGLRASLMEGRTKADGKVAAAMYKRAMGYEQDEVDIRTVSIGGGVSQIVQTPTKKHYPASDAAAMFILKNRHPTKWRDRNVSVLENPDGSALAAANSLPVLAALTLDQLRELAGSLKTSNGQESNQEVAPVPDGPTEG